MKKEMERKGKEKTREDGNLLLFAGDYLIDEEVATWSGWVFS